MKDITAYFIDYYFKTNFLAMEINSKKLDELLKNRIGVTENDLEEVTTDLIPMGAKIFCA